MKIIKRKNLKEYLRKYGHAYKKGKLSSILIKDYDALKHKEVWHKARGTELKVDDKLASLLKENNKFYQVRNKYYQCGKISKDGVIALFCSTALLVTGVGVGTYYLVNRVKNTTADIKSEEVKEYTEIVSESKPIIGEEYKCEINITSKGKEEGDNQKFMPATFKTVTTGGVVLPNYNKDSKVSVSPINNSTSYSNNVINNSNNEAEPENYYTYTLDESRTKGNLYIKKILGPVVIDFDLSNIKSIEITNKPHKLIYYVGQKFEANGLTIFATDVHGNTKQIMDNDSNIKLSISNGYEFDESDVGTHKVTAIYKEASTSFDIEVIKDAITEIEIDSSKCKMNYLVDEAINLDGLIVKARFKSSSEFKEIKGYSVSPSIGSSFDEAGNKNITIQVPGAEEKSFEVKVTEHSEMRIASLPSKVVYKVGDEFTLAGLKMSISKRTEGQRGIMDNRDRKYEISSDSDIQEGYTFKQEDIGHLKKIIIKHTNKNGESYLNTFYVSVPLDCTLSGENDFITQFSKPGTTYNAFKLNDAGLYDFSGTKYGGSGSDVMIIGTDGAMFDAVGKDKGSEGYVVDWFSGLNIMICNLTFNRNNDYFYMPGFVSYKSAIYTNVIFNENYWYWGDATYEPQEHTSNLFFNCEFNTRINDTYNDYACDLYSGNLEFNKCVFNSNTRHVKTNAGRSYGRFFLTFNDCKFKSNHSPFEDPDNPGKYDDHLINMDDVNCAPVTLSLNNCIMVDKEEEKTYHTKEFFWYKVKSNAATAESERSLVFINGEKKY